MQRLILLLVVSLSAMSALSNDSQTGIFSVDFKTLQVQLEGKEFVPPVMILGSNDRLTVSFDELKDDVNYLRYSLEHCDARWNPSGLVADEYVTGFNEGAVDDYRFSAANTVNYVHYSITIPNEDINVKLSGNYLLKIFAENNPGETLLQTRFSVSENLLSVTGNVSSRTDIDTNGRHQQLDITVDAGRSEVQDLYNNLIVEIVCNGQSDNTRYIMHPQRVAGRKAYYGHQRELLFPAGNTFRRFDTSSVTYPGINVASVDYHGTLYNATLCADEPRIYGTHNEDISLNGHFKIRDYDSADSDTEADYVLTHFTLVSPPLPGNVYIDGDLGYHRYLPATMMHYDDAGGVYRGTLLLKQGAYSYRYVVMTDKSLPVSASPIEGDDYRTVNEYTVNVYYRVPGGRYDRLLGTTTIYSGK